MEHFIQQSKDNSEESQDLNTDLFENALSLPGVKVRECLIPRKEINMKSQVSGIIEKLYVVAGQQVKQGDVIAKVKIIPNINGISNIKRT